MSFSEFFGKRGVLGVLAAVVVMPLIVFFVVVAHLRDAWDELA